MKHPSILLGQRRLSSYCGESTPVMQTPGLRELCATGGGSIAHLKPHGLRVRTGPQWFVDSALHIVADTGATITRGPTCAYGCQTLGVRSESTAQ